MGKEINMLQNILNEAIKKKAVNNFILHLCGFLVNNIKVSVGVKVAFCKHKTIVNVICSICKLIKFSF